jgi:hypothetical protein
MSAATQNSKRKSGAELPQRLQAMLGLPGLAAITLIGLTMLFVALALSPLERRNLELDDSLSRASRRMAAAGDVPGGSAVRMAAFYDYFKGDIQGVEALSRLQQVAAQSGIEIRSADYRMLPTGTRIERYEVLLPVTATYGQLRDFLRNALAQVPVLSLDQLSIRKQKAADGQVQAEVRLTLHLVKK